MAANHVRRKGQRYHPSLLGRWPSAVGRWPLTDAFRCALLAESSSSSFNVRRSFVRSVTKRNGTSQHRSHRTTQFYTGCTFKHRKRYCILYLWCVTPTHFHHHFGFGVNRSFIRSFVVIVRCGQTLQRFNASTLFFSFYLLAACVCCWSPRRRLGGGRRSSS